MTLDAVYARRITRVRAVQVTHANLSAVAVWAGGSTWGATVRVPGSHDQVAEVGDWVVRYGQTFEVWTDADFRDEWVPEMSVYVQSIYQPITETRAGCHRKDKNTWCLAHGAPFPLGKFICDEAKRAHSITGTNQ